MTRVGFLHTVGFLVDEFRTRVAADLPDVDAFHVLNESLLRDLLRGEPTKRVYRRVVQQIELIEDAGADLVVVTCSSTSPAVDIARQTSDIPVLKIDDPMARLAVTSGRRIGLVCTASSTLDASRALLLDHASELGRPIEIVARLLPEAYEAILSGNREEHDRIVRAAATGLAPEADVIVLAQASLAHLRSKLADELGVPVLASPDLLMAELVRMIGPAPADDSADA